MVSRGKEKAAYNLIFSREKIIPTRNIHLYRIRLIIKWKTMGGGEAGKGGPSPMVQACTF